MTQIALPLRFDRQFSFDNYYSNQADFVVSSLKSFVEASGENFIVLWGPGESGKTHLLNATAHYARSFSMGLQMYDAGQLVDLEPSCLSEIADGSFLAIDNLDAVCRNPGWETVFYDLINRCRQWQIHLLISLSARPHDLNCALPDLQSRLCWGLLLELKAADESEIENIVRQRAMLLGHTLSQEVTGYLVRHYPRGLGSQLEILHRLDRASLSTKKKITIPLIKQVLD